MEQNVWTNFRVICFSRFCSRFDAGFWFFYGFRCFRFAWTGKRISCGGLHNKRNKHLDEKTSKKMSRRKSKSIRLLKIQLVWKPVRLQPSFMHSRQWLICVVNKSLIYAKQLMVSMSRLFISFSLIDSIEWFRMGQWPPRPNEWSLNDEQANIDPEWLKRSPHSIKAVKENPMENSARFIRSSIVGKRDVNDVSHHKNPLSISWMTSFISGLLVVDVK